MASELVQPGETVLRVPLACCLHVEAVSSSREDCWITCIDRIAYHHTIHPTTNEQADSPRSVLAPLVHAEPDLIASLPDDEVLALLLMAERRAGKRSFWWPYLWCVLLLEGLLGWEIPHFHVCGGGKAHPPLPPARLI